MVRCNGSVVDLLHSSEIASSAISLSCTAPATTMGKGRSISSISVQAIHPVPVETPPHGRTSLRGLQAIEETPSREVLGAGLEIGVPEVPSGKMPTPAFSYPVLRGPERRPME